MREAVATDRAPKAIGPYSQAIRAGSLLFCSGQIPLDPATGALVDGDIAAQTRQVFANITAILQNLDDFAAMNEVYATFFASPAPARSTVAAAGLPRNARIEIEVIALV